MSFRSLILAITFLAIFAMGLRPAIDADTWWHLRTGELIAERRAIPTMDSFSFTRTGQPWHYPSTAWLMELNLYFIYVWFGPGGLNVLIAGIITLAFVFIYMAMSGGGFLRAFVLVLAASVSGVYWAARPYMATFLLSAIFLWILEEFRWERKNRLLWLPVLMALWVNSHAGFALGFMLVGVYLVHELLRWLTTNWPPQRSLIKAAVRGRVGAFLLVILGMLAAANLNPSGPAIFGFPFETVSIGVLREYIEEWQSPNFHDLAAQPFIWLLLLTIAAIGAGRKRIALSDFLLLAVSVYLSLLAGRNLPLFALVAPIVLTRYAVPVIAEARKYLNWRDKSLGKTNGWRGALNWAILVVLTAVVFARAWVVFPEEVNKTDYVDDAPVGAVEFIKEQQPIGRIFNSYNWGGYLIWNLRSYPVYIDGRTDLYNDGLLDEWLNIVSGNAGWDNALRKWDMRLVLIEPMWPLAKILPNEGWQLLYQDEYSVLYER